MRGADRAYFCGGEAFRVLVEARQYVETRSANAVTKSVVKTLAACIVGLSLTFSPALSVAAVERPTAEVECKAAGMRWVQQTGKCKQVKRVAGRLSTAKKVLGLIGLGCAVVGLVLLFGWREPERG